MGYIWKLQQKSWKDDLPSICQPLIRELKTENGRICVRILRISDAGHIFMEKEPSEITQLLSRAKDFDETVRVVTQHIWGSYLMVLHDQENGSRLFMADPLYTVRVYYRASRDGSVEIDADIGKFISGSSVSWNIDYLTNFACSQFGIPGETPFSGVRTVPPGCAMTIDINGKISMHRAWLPHPVHDDDILADCPSALDKTYSSIVSTHSTVCTALSGGVDSSAGAILLRRAIGPGKPIQAIHFFSASSPEFNEVELARQVAGSINADLICINIEDHLPFSEMTTKAPPASLSQDMLFLGIDREISRRIGAQAVLLEGQGGDLIFNSSPDASVVLDAFHDRGLAFAFQTAETLAMLHNESVPRVLVSAARLAARRCFLGDRSAVGLSGVFRNYRSRTGSDSALFRTHPFSQNRSPSFSHTIASLDSMLTIMTPATESAYTRRLNPLLMQPVVEAALAMKTYEGFTSENDRIVLRRIAHSYTPTDVLWRRTKGTFDIGFMKGIQENCQEFRELVYNGVLMGAGRLDETEFEKMLRQVSVGQSAAGITLALIGCVEIFCAAWTAHLSGRRALLHPQDSMNLHRDRVERFALHENCE